MKPAAGPILRRVGLLIEMACLLALVTLDDGRRSLAGISVRALLIGGVVLGFLLWGLSLAMLVRDTRQSRSREL